MHILYNCFEDAPDSTLQRFMELSDPNKLTCLLGSKEREIALQTVSLLNKVLANAKNVPSALKMKHLYFSLQRLKLESAEFCYHACCCITSLIFISSRQQGVTLYEEINGVLLDLVSLLEDNKWCFETLKPLGEILRCYSGTRKFVIQLDIVPKLLKLLAKNSERNDVLLLNILSQICDESEVARRQSFGDNIEHLLCQKIGSASTDLQVAVCRCLHAVSRSPRALRDGFLKDVLVLESLVEYTKQRDDDELSFHSSCILVNLCSEPSNVRENLLRQGILDVFLSLSQSHVERMKEIGILGISSLAYLASETLKGNICSSVNWSFVVKMLEDDNANVVVRCQHMFVMSSSLRST